MTSLIWTFGWRRGGGGQRRTAAARRPEVGSPPSRKRARKHRSSTVAEGARLYGVHRNTVRHWMKSGLAVVRAGGLVLILGEELERFRNERKADRRRPCPPGTIYCLKCRELRQPIPASVDQTAANDRTAIVIGLCGACGTRMNRRTRLTDLHLWRAPSDGVAALFRAGGAGAAAGASSSPNR